MKQGLSYLFSLCALAGLPRAATGQCGYPATIQTNKDYCVGSSLIAGSTHALQKIVWYHNGQPVQTVTGSQAFDSLPTQYTFFPYSTIENGAIDNLATDGSGNIYFAEGSNRVFRWTPGGPAPIQVVGPTPLLVFGNSLCVDQAGNIYAGNADTTIAASDSALILEFYRSTPGATDSTVIVSKSEAQPYDYNIPVSLAVDCQGDLYSLNYLSQTVVEWPAGLRRPFLVALPTGVPGGCSIAEGRVRIDNRGNIFFSAGNGVQEMSPGAPAASILIPPNCGQEGTDPLTDFYPDAGDTLYVDGMDLRTNHLFVQKWAPGAGTGITIADFPVPANGLIGSSMTMDIRGNLFLSAAGEYTIYELRRHSAIDSAYTPSDTGAYWAVVTDIQGYTTTTDTLRINAPLTGPAPSVSITATTDSATVCTPISFTATAAGTDTYPDYQWVVSGVHVGADSPAYSNSLFANGDQVYCVLTAQAGCAGPVTDTSNIIGLYIDPHGTASVTISTLKDSVCQGGPIEFTATVTDGSSQPVFQWLLNGDSTGDITDTFIRSNLSDGDVVTCLIVSDDACGLAKSNSLSVTIGMAPVITPGQIFTIPYGQSLQLEPAVTGAVSSWRWSPATGLSDPSIPDPVADPAATTLYTLVAADKGCADTAAILVNVYTPLSIPNAFTPNGDGRNDLFYVLGGPINSRVAEFAVFNREGAEVFHVHGVAPGDPTFAWNGSFHGSPAPTGTYVYFVVMEFADGRRQPYKGTVILLR
jgi:gliding motility-associated-like protein